MSSNIFQSNDFDSTINRIAKLSSNSNRKWGKMSLVQMLEHCSIQLKLALGIIPQSNFEGFTLYRTAFGRWLALYVMPWPRGLATPSKMNVVATQAEIQELEIAKQELTELLQRVKETKQLNSHPYFGKLDLKDWGRLIYKHLDHHLKQFGS